MNNEFVIECQHLSKSYQEGKIKTDVLTDVNLCVKQAEQVAIVGASGSGKSTLLHILGGLDKPTQGMIKIDGQEIHRLPETERCILRNKKLGFVYQFHHLLPEFTVFENVCMPLMLSKVKKETIEERAKDILDKVGLSHRLLHKLSEISGGERQRTALARALVAHPDCVLADEPTGNLDNKTAETVYELMLLLNKTFKTSFIIVTHDLRLASRMDRVLTLADGILSDITDKVKHG